MNAPPKKAAPTALPEKPKAKPKKPNDPLDDEITQMLGMPPSLFSLPLVIRAVFIHLLQLNITRSLSQFPPMFLVLIQ